MTLPNFYIDDIIKTALAEDITYIDIASDLLLPDSNTTTAVFKSKAGAAATAGAAEATNGVIAGIDIALRVFKAVDDTVTVTKLIGDGARVKYGDIIARVSGKTSSILKAERTSLNFLQHMSGIATYTAKCVAAVAGYKAVIADTRKTLPGLRRLQKYAVTVGGGKNHRYNLSDCAMLKDNHIDAYGGITGAVAELRKRIGHTVAIEVEARNLADVREAIAADVSIVMLDNMTHADMTEAVRLAGDGNILFEASGNVTLDNITDVAATGVDIISLGALTHSVTAFDVSLVVGD